MRALQVWCPALGPSFGHADVRRDVHRAFEAWRGDHAVYLVPDLAEPYRYTERDGACGERQVLVFPASHLDRLDVFHVGPRGYVWGPAAHERFPNGQVTGLLKRFLSPDFLCNVSLSVPGVLGRLKVPLVRDGHVRVEGEHVLYEVKRFFELGHVLPITSIHESGRFTIQWPPKARGCRPIEPDAESCDYSNQEPADLTGRACVRWGAPFTRLFTFASGLDELVAHIEMGEIKRLDDRALALHQARAALSRFASEGTSTVGLVGFWPAYAEAVQASESLHAFWEEFGVLVSSFEEARSAEKLREPRPVRRVYGGLGLLWALLVDELERGAHFCIYCGAPLRRQGRYCARRDSLECFRAGRTADQRRRAAVASGARARSEDVTP
jgi:hypothetical protein